MSSTENTRPGSFKGVELRIKDVTVTEGIKRAKYSYLNSNRRTQKALVEWPPEFVVNGYTYGSDGDSYSTARDRLRAALKTSEPGIYVDAWLGNNNCASDVYEFSQSHSETNRCNFKITFTTYTDSNSQPQISTGITTTNTVNTQSLKASRSLQDAAGASMGGTDYVLVEQKKSFFENVGDLMPEAFGKIGDTISQVSAYAETAFEMKEDSEFYANNPLIGIAAVADTLLGVDGLTTDVYAKLSACEYLFDWGNNLENDNGVFVSSNPTTYEDAQGYTNKHVQKTFIQTSGLIEAYKQSVKISYDTADDIDDAISLLESQFSDCRDNLNVKLSFPYNFISVIQPDFYDAYVDLKELRRQAIDYLNNQKKTAKTIQYVDVPDMPAAVLAYRLYGDSQRDDEIMELNNLYDNMSISGSIKVYTDV